MNVCTRGGLKENGQNPDSGSNKTHRSTDLEVVSVFVQVLNKHLKKKE